MSKDELIVLIKGNRLDIAMTKSAYKAVIEDMCKDVIPQKTKDSK